MIPVTLAPAWRPLLFWLQLITSIRRRWPSAGTRRSCADIDPREWAAALQTKSHRKAASGTTNCTTHTHRWTGAGFYVLGRLTVLRMGQLDRQSSAGGHHSAVAAPVFRGGAEVHDAAGTQPCGDQSRTNRSAGGAGSAEPGSLIVGQVSWRSSILDPPVTGWSL